MLVMHINDYAIEIQAFHYIAQATIPTCLNIVISTLEDPILNNLFKEATKVEITINGIYVTTALLYGAYDQKLNQYKLFGEE